jgi:hypothetical protein
MLTNHLSPLQTRQGAINTVARVIAPLVMGEIYRRAGSTAAFCVAGASVATAAVMASVRRYMVLLQRNNNDNMIVRPLKSKEA